MVPIWLLAAVSAVLAACAGAVKLLGGDFRAFLLHLGWSVLVWMGLWSYLFPGVILLGVMSAVAGPVPALLTLLGPVGSAVVATAYPGTRFGPIPFLSVVSLLITATAMTYMGVLPAVLSKLSAQAMAPLYILVGGSLAVSLASARESEYSRAVSPLLLALYVSPTGIAPPGQLPFALLLLPPLVAGSLGAVTSRRLSLLYFLTVFLALEMWVGGVV
jgi:hypothetical protein